LTGWAKTLQPGRIEIEKLTQFPEPNRIIILQVNKTPELCNAFVSLAELSQQAHLPEFDPPQRPIDQWIFHMSVAYCGQGLEDQEWLDIAQLVQEKAVRPVSCEVDEAELVSYAGLEESIQVLPFGHTR
jgi:2'-5' RNA ligase